MHTTHAPELRSLAIVMLALTLFSCAPASRIRAPAPGDLALEMSAEALLAELQPRGGAAFIQAWNGDDPEAVAAFYTEDAVVVVDPETIYRGRAEILNGFIRPQVATISKVTPALERVVGGPEQMTLVGIYTARISPSDGPSYRARGTFGNTWVRQPDGSWKVRASVTSPPSPAGAVSMAQRVAGDLAAERELILAQDRSLLKAIQERDVEKIASFYAPDATGLPPDVPAIHGREAVAEYWRRSLAASAAANCALVPERPQINVSPSAEMAYEIGVYTAHCQGPDGPVEAKRKYVVVWAKTGGEWKIVADITNRAEPPTPGAHRAVPGEAVRVVRFNVKPDQRAEFEGFFWESLKPAAAKRQGVAVEDLDLGGFRLLIPAEVNPQGYFTYYMLVDPVRGPLGAGEVMRDMVREAFPGEEGQERVRRWMQSMVLEEPFAPEGGNFTEADLLTPNPPR